MRVHLRIEIQGTIDSLMLWELIKSYKLNLTDFGEIVLVYGECSYMNAGSIISKCALFGNLTAKITRGCDYEQKETKKTES